MVLNNKQTKAHKSKIVSGVAGRNIVAVICICAGAACAIVELLNSKLYAKEVYSQTKPELLNGVS